MALSPNYGWSEPDNSSLVKNGASDIRTLGDAIDTSVWNVGFGQAGKNKIINGDFRVNQRNFTSVTSNATYCFDRFVTRINGDGTATFTPQTFTPGSAPVAGYEAINFLQVVTASQTNSAVFTVVRQYIEDVRTFAGQTVTVSFWAKATSGTPKVSISLTQYFGSGGSAAVTPTPTGVTLSTAWARYSATIVVPSISGATIGTGSYLQLNLCVSAGSTFTADFPVTGIQNNTFQFWGVQVEYGSKATPFQTATGTLQGELAACQRYYMRYYDISGSNAVQVNMGTCASTTAALFPITHPVTLRIGATALDVGTMAASDGVTGYTTGTFTLTASNQTPSRSMVTYTHGSAALTQFRPMILNGQSASSFIGFSAEL